MPNRLSSSWAWASAELVSSAAPEMPEARVADEYVHPAGPPHHFGDGGADRVLVRDVAGDVLHALRGHLMARELEHPALRLRQRTGRAAADPAAAPGNYGYLHVL